MRAGDFKVFFFGDSICFGQGVSLHRGWVAQVSMALSDDVDPSLKDLLFVNSSVNGNTTRIALERMPYDVQSHSPDIVIVQFGLNDCNYWDSDKGVPRVSPRGFMSNIKEIVDRCFIHGAKKVILNTNHPTTMSKKILNVETNYNESNRDYNKLLRNVVSELANNYGEKLVFLDIESKFDSLIENDKTVCLEDLLLPDGLHLSERGHDIYFENIISILKEVILEAKS